MTDYFRVLAARGHFVKRRAGLQGYDSSKLASPLHALQRRNSARAAPAETTTSARAVNLISHNESHGAKSMSRMIGILIFSALTLGAIGGAASAQGRHQGEPGQF